jgi:hypothetical protein
VAAGRGGNLATSTDGITWTARTSGTTTSIFTVTFGNGIFIRGGISGALATSTDGITWTARTSGTTTSIYKIRYGNGIFVRVGAAGTIGTSTDGITWTSRTSGITTNIAALVYGNGIFVQTGASTGLATSTNGITWTSHYFQSGGVSIAYGQNVYVLIDDLGYMASSTNGINWRTSINPKVRVSPQEDFGQHIAYDNGVFITYAGYSLDGIIWNRYPNNLFTTRSCVGAANGTYFTGDASGNMTKSTALYTYNTASEFALPDFTQYENLYIKG